MNNVSKIKNNVNNVSKIKNNVNNVNFADINENNEQCLKSRACYFHHNNASSAKKPCVTPLFFLPITRF